MVQGLSDVKAICATNSHCYALKTDGTVYAWGGKTCSVGFDVAVYGSTPVKKTELWGITDIKAFDDFAMALKSDKTVWAWGCNEYLSLGDGKLNPALIPNRVDGQLNDTQGDFPENAHEVSDNSVTNAWFDYNYDYDWYTFVASKSGEYTIYTTSDFDIEAFLHDEDSLSSEEIAYAHGDENNRIEIKYSFIKDKRYYLKLRQYTGVYGAYQLHIEKPVSCAEIYVPGTEGQSSWVVASVNNLSNIENCIFQLEYYTSQVEPEDLVMQTYGANTTAGTYGRVQIMSVEPGIIKFKLTGLALEPEMAWSGILNVFKFRYKTTTYAEMILKLL